MKRWLIFAISILATTQATCMMRQKKRRNAFSLSPEENCIRKTNLLNRRAEALQLSNEEKDEMNNLETYEKKHEFLNNIRAEQLALIRAAEAQQDNDMES